MPRVRPTPPGPTGLTPAHVWIQAAGADATATADINEGRRLKHQQIIAALPGAGAEFAFNGQSFRIIAHAATRAVGLGTRYSVIARSEARELLGQMVKTAGLPAAQTSALQAAAEELLDLGAPLSAIGLLLLRVVTRSAQAAAPSAPTAPPPPARRAPKKNDPYYDLQNVQAPAHIAPGKESIRVQYDIVNVGNSISSGQMRILRAKDNKELQSIALSADQYTAGHHAITWDGSVSSDAEFPDGFVTIEHSAYLVEISIGDQFGPRRGSARIKVEMKQFIVEKAAKSVLTDPKDQKIWEQVQAIPTAGLQKLMLDSNLFAVQSSDMNDGTAFSAYQTLWADGPRIPLRATVTVIDSQGKEVRAGMAMGRAKVLWDYTDPVQTQPPYLAAALAPPPALSQSAGAKPFVDAAIKYDSSASKPAGGDNCHVDRGGKRASAAGTAVMAPPDGAVTAFPFTVNAGTTRWWAGFGDFLKSGDEEARAGVLFRPSRMAGDNYVLKAYLDISCALDTADDKPAGAMAEAAVGSFEVWRQITMPAHFKKCAGVTQVMPSFAQYYADAFVNVDDQRGAPKPMTKAAYDAAFAAALPSAQSRMQAYGGGYAIVGKYALPAAGVSQYDAARMPGTLGGRIVSFLGKVARAVTSTLGLTAGAAPTTWVATFLPYGDFIDAVSAGQGLTDAATRTLLRARKLGDEAAYAQRTTDYAVEIATDIAKNLATQDGLTVLQFDWASSLEELIDGTHRINGNACFKSLSICGFALYNTDTAADAGVAQTPAHEIGHNLFLPHAPRLVQFSNGATTVLDETTYAALGYQSDGGILKDRHDIHNRNCLMSYARPRPGFCGLCLIRLRGWDESVFDENGGTVSKP
jgi:hypothetical protein